PRGRASARGPRTRGGGLPKPPRPVNVRAMVTSVGAARSSRWATRRGLRGLMMGAAALGFGGACRSEGSPTTPPASASSNVSEVTLDGDRLYARVAALASDGLAGRFTLSPSDVERAAAFIAEDLKDSGVHPVGSDYRTPF